MWLRASGRLDRLAATRERRRSLGRGAIDWRCFLQFRVRGLIGGLDLSDAILERLVVRAGLGELVVHPQRQLSVTLLEIELRHSLVDERLRTRPAEGAFFFPGLDALGDPGFYALRRSRLSALRCSGFNALRDTGFNALRRGEPLGFLPDQVPGEGEGEWAEFFGRPAYTMTLAAKIAARPNVACFLAYARRLPRGAGYDIVLRPLPAALPGERPTRRLNRALEALVRECPGQYLWSYNRYKTPRGAKPRTPQ